ncbi:MAG: glycosyltransferase [Planctomycetota bacterium]
MNPKCTVIFPCRGLEPGLETNARAVLAQDYPAYEVLLVTTADDASLPLLQRLAGEYSGRARVVVAEWSATCAQKLANQVAATRAAAPETAVYVFLDSDGLVPPGFVRRMIAPLADPGVGMVTGWRWYLAERGRFWSYVRSAWNAGAMPFLVDNRHNIAFGGAMAVWREVFERAGVMDKWCRGVSDGLMLARAVKDLGLRVKFAPRCIAVSREGGSFSEVLEWTNRQTTISHVCMPEFWRFTAMAHSVSILVLVGTVVAGGLAAGGWGAVCAMAVYLGLLEANAVFMVYSVSKALESGVARELRDGVGWYVLAAPVASWLYGVNIARSILSRRITWRGISYELINPVETVLLENN